MFYDNAEKQSKLKKKKFFTRKFRYPK